MQKLTLHSFFTKLKANIPFQVHFWDNTSEKYGDGETKLIIHFKDKISITQFMKEPSITFGEAYMDGKIHIEGKIEDLINLAAFNKKQLWTKKLSNLRLKNTMNKQKKNVQHHYDLGNDFFELWLDETMSYSCAYFKNPSDSLHQAQINKIDHVLKKLQLKPGEKLLDIGSGWGWLIIKAAQEYGVHSHGVTLSEEQYKITKQRIESLGLTDRVQVELIDYRELWGRDLSFDKIASVGMFEHVGQENYPIFMEAIDNLLQDGGLALLHTITHQTEDPVDPWIDKYIFPGGYVPSLREIVTLLPDHHFHVQDIESLRLHYAQTLDHWAERYEQKINEVEKLYDERFVRMWRLYLQSSAAFFRNGGLNIHQILFTKGINNHLEKTRNYMYR